MIEMTLAEIAQVVGGTAYGDTTTVVSGPAFLDSRRPEPGGLFVAVAGERVDGHDFAAGAVSGGAAAVLAQRDTGVPAVVVADPEAALATLARHVLDTLRPTVLAMTGSQGKTTVKDYLAHVLGQAGPTVATAGNLNNELGVPLTVLRTQADTRWLVVEMGARGVGHIAQLCRIAPPTISAVLNVGTAHLGEFGSREAIAQAKGEIVEALTADGTAVLNADDDLVSQMGPRTVAPVVTFGVAGEVTWRGVELDDLGRASFELGAAGEWHPVRLRQAGLHQVPNVAAAAAMARAAGVPLADVAAAASEATSASRWRMELHERADGLVVVNDAYNANPASMRAAIDAVRAIGERSGRRTVAVLGVMLELGETSAAEHRALGAYAAESGVGVLVAVGEEGALIADGAESAPGWSGTAVRTAGRDQAVDWVRNNVGAEDVVLVKASRGAALEVVADALLEDPHR